MPPDPRSHEELDTRLDEYLARLGEDSELDIAALCAQHPDHAAELSRLFAERTQQVTATSVFAPRGRRSEPSLVRQSARAGDVLGDFRLIEQLGRGGMGEVWLADQLSLERQVALKLVLPERVNEHSLSLFAREARAGGRLAHPGIVTVFGHGTTDGVAWIAMELVEGAWNLRNALDELEPTHLPLGYYEQVASFGAELADAIGAAHDARVIHRDLKPQNVLVTPADHPKLTDFGLARIQGEDLSVTAGGAGTYYYMSPEQVSAERGALDHRTDVFSFGVVLYEMLTLRRPFEGDTVNQVTEQILAFEPPSPRLVRSKVPEDLAVITGKCLEKDRERRYASMAEVAADLRRHLANESILATPPTAIQRAAKWVKRHPTRSVAAALVVFALAVISVLLAENIRANADLTTSNESLDRKTREAERLAAERAEQAQLAREQAAIAQAERKDVLRLSAQQDLEDLLVEQTQLWPADPENLSAFRQWSERAEALLADLPRHVAKREELRALALPQAEEERITEREWRFGEDQDEARWWNANLTKLIEGLTALERDLLAPDAVTAEHGWSVGKRLAFAEQLESGFAAGGEYDVLWQRDLPAIRAAYPDLDLKPQLGLVPIGPDPESGLWEFAHLATGEPPVRRADGKLVLTEEMGVVLVLIPSGSFTMGAQSADASQPNYDPQALSTEGPVHTVSLSAYLLSKYEMTQGQWLRVAGRNPSNYQPPYSLTPSLLHPVELVPWPRCMEVLPRVGLSLPSEAQWECGARGGTSTAWWLGQDREDLRGKVNIADKSAADVGANWASIQDWPDHDDGGAVHREAGAYPANPFGLHEVHGNIKEWCLDGYDPGFYAQPGSLDPVSDPEAHPSRVYRGGGFEAEASFARSARRGALTPAHANNLLGFRPARVITE